jgi:serine/threonine protein kinase
MTLSVKQMAQMCRLLDEALDFDEAGRRHWLDALAAEHRELERALSQVLIGDAGGSRDLRTLPKLEGPAGALRAGQQVGPYELVRRLGAGGMAQVWLALRTDGAFHREVALKLPVPRQLRRDLTSRFARECDILAALEHPNIARLYDAGISAEGLRYMAMEYVAGDPLVEWCDRRCLEVRERLTLFLQVLDAVQYANSHKVIHRDIKPSNILVTGAGQVRLLDFGVAKILEPDEDRTELTRIYGRALTPAYASPEVLRGDPADAASDVYALGLVLQELLAGSRPCRVKPGAAIDRTQRIAVSGRLRGDLDVIVLKALAERPANRYPSAAALARDLQRYLRGEPIHSSLDRVAHRPAGTDQKHRTGVNPLGAAAVLLVAAVGAALFRTRSAPQSSRSPGPTGTGTRAT